MVIFPPAELLRIQTTGRSRKLKRRIAVTLKSGAVAIFIFKLVSHIPGINVLLFVVEITAKSAMDKDKESSETSFG